MARNDARLGLLALALLAALAPPVLAATSEVTGQVIDSESLAPIAGADVELQNAGGGQGYFRTRTDGGGAFTVKGVPSDRWYTLTVGAAGYTDWVLGGWQFPGAQRQVKLVVPLDRAGRIAVRVVGADAKTPVAGARVWARRERGASWWEAYRREPDPSYTSRTGEVAFDGLSAGEYTVQVEAAGLRTTELRRVAVRRGETTKLDVPMTRPASLAGVVRLADSSGVAGVSVIARGPMEATGTTDATGAYAIGDLAPGRYRVEVQHDGLEPSAIREAVVLREGQSRDGVDLRVRPRPVAFSWVLQREVFAPEQPVAVGLRSFRVGRVSLTLWRIPPARLLDPQRDVRALAQGADTAGLVRAQTWTHDTPDGPPFAWREEEMTVAKELPAGVYLLEGVAGTLRRRVVFFVSDLGLVVKRSGTQAVVWAGSLKTGVPLRNVAVFAIGTGGEKQVENGRDWLDAVAAARTRRMVTDDDGLLRVPFAGPQAFVRVVAMSETNGFAVAESPLSGAARQGGDAAFLFTERPIYRPGQTLYWKLFARKAAGGGYALPDRTATRMSLSGPDGATLDVAGRPLSEHGSADGAVELPADLPLGEWTLGASAGAASATATFAVQQYRKPEFRVEVTPDRPVAVNGDEVRFRIAADYFFGAPVPGATVRYNLFESRLRPPAAETDEAWWDDDGGEVDAGGYGRVLQTGETRTDVDGRVSLAFTPARVAYDRRLTLEAEVVDPSQRVVSGRGSMIVGRGLFTVQLVPQNRMVTAGRPIVVDVRTRDHEGKPVSAAVTIDLDQDVWNPLERTYTRSSRPIASVHSTTSAREGRARVTIALATARAGALSLRARADDARGNRITAETSVWVYDPKVWSYAYRYPSLEAFPDKPRYAPGDTARIVVNTDVKDAAVLASLEGRELHEAKVVHLFGNTGLVTFAIRADHAPNAFVALHVRRGREVLTRTLELPVDAARHDLSIALTADKTGYKPRDEATLGVETRDGAGRPVPAEVAIGVVDESIYSLRADATPNPHDVFYGRRPNWVTTVVSFPTLYYGGADKSAQTEPRRDFRDVALWAPAVTTGADGRASVRVPFPDNLTTWRATARGATDATLVGDTITKMLVTKDLVARLAVPRALVAGDDASLVSVITNRTQQPLTGVSESLEATGPVRINGPASATSSVAPGGESRSTWRVAVPAEATRSAAPAVLTFRAKSKADADAIEQTVPVLPKAVALRPHAAGSLAAGAATAKATVEARLPGDLIRAGSEVELTLSPSPAAMALAATEYLTAFPYACTEQTANAILPAAALLDAAKAADRALPGWEEPGRRLTPFVERLIALKSPEGGWGWWGSGDPDPYLSALAMDALARAAALGVQADGATSAIQQSLYAMGRMLGDVRTPDGEAYALMHLSSLTRVPQANERFFNLREQLDATAASLAVQQDRLGVAGLACAAIACSRLGRAADAKALLEKLMARGVRDGAGLSFPSDPGAEDGWFGDTIENSAYALSALSAIAPGDSRAEAMVRWLAARRTGRDWRSTRVTGPVAIALADHLGANKDEWRGAEGASVTWNGASVFDGPLGDGATVRIAGDRLQGGENALAIAKTGSGALHWAWRAKALVPSPGPQTRDARLLVKREYFRAAKTTDRRGRPRYLVSEVPANEPMRVGETILVRLTLTAARGMSWLMLEDPRPSGFEVDTPLPDGVERPYGTHGETRDDRSVFFVDRIDAGETVIEYLIRPEIAGAFTALPASAGSMYDPDLVSRGAEARLRVVAP